ncbi:MAG: tetratricopeptide repeat protein [Actinomycetes bacterium]
MRTRAPHASGDGDATLETTRRAPRGKDKNLRRILIIMVEATVLLVVLFGVVYYVGQRTNAGPTLSERAISSAEEKVRTDPNSLGARLALAQAYGDAGRPGEALTQYAEITKADPSNRDAMLGAGFILYSQGDLPKALEQFQSAVKVSGGEEFSAADPQLEEALYYVGRITLEKGDAKGAIDPLEKALKIDKTDSDAWYYLGDAQVRNGDPARGAQAYAQALTFVPWGWCDPYTGLEAAYTKLGDKDGVAYATAMTKVCEGKSEDGVASLKALQSGPYRIQGLLGLGLAAESSGDVTGAVDWYSQVTAIEPKNVAALTALSRLQSGVSSGPTSTSSTSGTAAPAS